MLDEAVTTATSVVNGVTVHRPESTLRTLRKLADGFSYLISKMTGHSIYAHVTLEKGERSPLADLASQLL